MNNLHPIRPEKLLLLVGGLGTRLKSIVSDVPKPMAPIAGKPFLWYRLIQFKKMGFRKIVFLSGYLAKIIEDYFGNGEKFGLQIEYSIEKEPLGTGGALLNAKKFVDGPFFMANGDCYLEFDPIPILNVVKKNKAEYVMLLTVPDIPGAYGIVFIDKVGKIIKFVEKPETELESKLINAGVYYFTPKIFDYCNFTNKFSLEKHVFPTLVEKNLPFYGVEYKGYFNDIGIPERYRRFISDVESGYLQF